MTLIVDVVNCGSVQLTENINCEVIDIDYSDDGR